MEDIVQSKCGLCVTHTLHDAYSFIKSLQHRGREACGIFALGNNRLDVIKWKGSVAKVDLVDLHKIFPAHLYHTFGAHVRYATKGREDKILEDAHPHVIGGKLEDRGTHIIMRDCDAVAIHNGQVNFKEQECDTKLLLRYYLKNKEKALVENIPGSYVLAIADKKRNEVVVMRDKFGVKPACLGFKDGKYCVASEDIALIENGARFIEDLDAGVSYCLTSDGHYKKAIISPGFPRRHCFFEWNYVADQRSLINGLSVLKLRQELGKALAEEFHPKDTDVITFLPRCPEGAARSYSKALGVEQKFLPVFYKLRGERSFQGTTKEDRQSSIQSNLHILPEAEKKIKGKVILMIDDSTVRGNNSRHACNLLRKYGAKKVYLVNYTPKIGIIGSDNVQRGCLFGVDMPPGDDFVVIDKAKIHNSTNEEIDAKLGVKTHFLSVEKMLHTFEKAGIPRTSLCTFCIGGEHPFKK